jgi:uncharacterized iron-regulated membrane protein
LHETAGAAGETKEKQVMATQVRGSEHVVEVRTSRANPFEVRAHVAPVAQNGSVGSRKGHLLAEVWHKALVYTALAWFGILGDRRTQLAEDAKWRTAHLVVMGKSPSEAEANRR